MIKGDHYTNKVVVCHNNKAVGIPPGSPGAAFKGVSGGPGAKCVFVAILGVYGAGFEVYCCGSVHEKLGGQGDDVFIVASCVIEVRAAREGVGFIRGAGSVEEGDVVNS